MDTPGGQERRGCARGERSPTGKGVRLRLPELVSGTENRCPRAITENGHAAVSGRARIYRRAVSEFSYRSRAHAPVSPLPDIEKSLDLVAWHKDRVAVLGSRRRAAGAQPGRISSVISGSAARTESDATARDITASARAEVCHRVGRDERRQRR